MYIATKNITGRLVRILCIFVILAPSYGYTDDRLPEKATLSYLPVHDLVYAVAQEGAFSERENKFVIHKFQLGKPFTKPIAGWRYEYDTFCMELRYVSNDAGILPGGGGLYDTTSNGMLAAIMAAWREDREKGAAITSPLAFERIPVLFPCFSHAKMPLAIGSKWETLVAPMVLTESLGEKLLQQELSSKDLEPLTIQFHWRDSKVVNQWPCAVIDFSLQSKSIEKHNVGMEEAEYELTGTSYFSPDLGWPIVNVMQAKGFRIDRKGRKTDLAMRRKEMLTSAAKDPPKGK